VNQKNQKSNSVSRVVKNTIGICACFIFIFAMVLTGFIAFRDKDVSLKSNDSFNFNEFNGNNRPNMPSGGIPNMPNGNKPSNLPNEDKEQEDDEKDDLEDKEETNKDNKKSDRFSNKKFDRDRDNIKEVKVESHNSIKLFYVVLLMIESLLLGAAIMFLILSNIL